MIIIINYNTHWWPSTLIDNNWSKVSIINQSIVTYWDFWALLACFDVVLLKAPSMSLFRWSINFSLLDFRIAFACYWKFISFLIIYLYVNVKECSETVWWQWRWWSAISWYNAGLLTLPPILACICLPLPASSILASSTSWLKMHSDAEQSQHHHYYQLLLPNICSKLLKHSKWNIYYYW